MKLTSHTIEKLTPFLIYPNGKALVALFNDYGYLDKYDYDNGGLPDIGKKNGQRQSKSQYVEKRLNELSGKPGLRDLLNRLINDLNNPKFAIPEIDAILKRENFQIVKNNGNYHIEGGIIDNSPPVVTDAHFLDIQNQILEVLSSAKISIWVAMAWFTNDVLFGKLLEKQKEGVDVKVAIFDDGINKKHGVDIDRLPNWKIRGSRGGFMHNKFCVVEQPSRDYRIL